MMHNFLQSAEYQNTPIQKLITFLEEEQRNEVAENYNKMRFVGYVLDIGFDEVQIITSDPFKKVVGGVPRGSYLMMCPSEFNGIPPHFTLLRVSGVAATPLKQEMQQTYFELHKKSMPELDVWTQSELQWGALSTQVLGMFYPDQNDPKKLAFSGDVNNIVSAHHYKIFAPDDTMLDLIVNGTVKASNQFALGDLRLTECQLPFLDIPISQVPVKVSTDDFKGFRTAMFGKTRLGKSNVVKLIAQSILETTKEDKSVGQLIFDVNGEYANDNPQDGNYSLRSAYEDRCSVYALTQRPSTPSKPLKLNFYEQPSSTIQIIARLLDQDNQNAQYVRSFASVTLPDIEELKSTTDRSAKYRGIRKIQMYWAILSKAGFEVDEGRLRTLGMTGGSSSAPGHFDPHFRKELIDAVYEGEDYNSPTSVQALQLHLEKVAEFVTQNNGHAALSKNGKPLFDADDEALLKFLKPVTGGGPQMLRHYRQYHDKSAGNFVKEIIKELDEGNTVILDLGNAADEIRMYFSDLLSKAVFSHQEKKFTSNKLENHYIQLFFEEAHNLFPNNSNDFKGVYTRFAKEGAKFHIGMVYSTQSPSTINKELLIQTENFFIGHISSIDEVNALARLQILFEGMQKDITAARTPGFMRMLTFSHRFVVPVQTKLFQPYRTN